MKTRKKILKKDLFLVLDFITNHHKSFVFPFVHFISLLGLCSVGHFAPSSVTKAKGNLLFKNQHLHTDIYNLF